MRAIRPCVVLAIVLAACSSSNSGSGASVTVNGTLGGQRIPTTDAVGILATQPGNTGVTFTYAGVNVTNFADACSVVLRGGQPPNQTILLIGVGVPGSTIPPGTYPLGMTSTVQAEVEYHTTDAHCLGQQQIIASSGTVHLTETSGTIKGDFDATFATGERLTGTFAAPVCSYDPGTRPNPGPCGS